MKLQLTTELHIRKPEKSTKHTIKQNHQKGKRFPYVDFIILLQI